MRTRTYSYVRTHRRRCRLTQHQLAALVGLTREAVSRIERAERGPSAASLIACSIVFGLSTRELFPSIYGEVEENVLSSARTLIAELISRSDPESNKVRVLLEDLIQRITNRDKSQKL